MDRRVALTIQTMEERMAEPLRMPALAEAIHLSPSRLSHLFNRETGVSPVCYLRMLRMMHAARLLNESMLSVKEIMARVGCADPSHFSRDFRRMHGVSPRAYRQRSRDRGGEVRVGEFVNL